MRLISALQTGGLLNIGCVSFLASVVSTDESGVKLEYIPVVHEYSDVFQEDLPGLPPKSEVQLSIDLTPVQVPYSKFDFQTLFIFFIN